MGINGIIIRIDFILFMDFKMSEEETNHIFICNKCGKEFTLRLGYLSYLLTLFFHCTFCDSEDTKEISTEKENQ